MWARWYEFGSHALSRLFGSKRHCSPISAHRAFIGSLFIIDAMCWLDARQKQLQSATRTTPSGNRRQWEWIRTVWLRHECPLTLYRRELNVSLSHRRLPAKPQSVMPAFEIRPTARVNPRTLLRPSTL